MSGQSTGRELLAEATGRPWWVRTPGGFRWAQVIAGDAEDDPVASGLNDDDASLIVFAVNNLARLEAENEAMREALGEMERKIAVSDAALEIGGGIIVERMRTAEERVPVLEWALRSVLPCIDAAAHPVAYSAAAAALAVRPVGETQ